ncbi:helix-turn-helix domain-containing protein [[Mycobacterium] nativiensis]|uniref:Helix-turn-helix domain-containing protein n=1 Tax=[Mycobacterium] nativiensis TaxID=2855503 RepID=A0ABU5XWX7_9MYCO|nr:helix-turn-helix domain-containing protein [Mycolicibacter sp. MYC340]MEB3032288.1 helix-turn-helix domain-containing protein [Mycolicibacter sp. MYC340]
MTGKGRLDDEIVGSPAEVTHEIASAIMPRMMTTSQAIAALGISRNTLRRAIRKSGLRMTLTKSGVEYLFSPDDLDAVAQYLGKKQQPKATRGDGTPGLPLEWLNDPAHTAEFVAEGFAREARLMTLVRRRQRDCLSATVTSCEHARESSSGGDTHGRAQDEMAL